jgi:hypothetical protein
MPNLARIHTGSSGLLSCYRRTLPDSVPFGISKARRCRTMRRPNTEFNPPPPGGPGRHNKESAMANRQLEVFLMENLKGLGARGVMEAAERGFLRSLPVSSARH